MHVINLWLCLYNIAWIKITHTLLYPKLGRKKIRLCFFTKHWWQPFKFIFPWEERCWWRYKDVCGILLFCVGKKAERFQWIVLVLFSWHIFDSVTSNLDHFATLSYPSSCNVKLFSSNHLEQYDQLHKLEVLHHDVSPFKTQIGVVTCPQM